MVEKSLKRLLRLIRVGIDPAISVVARVEGGVHLTVGAVARALVDSGVGAASS